MSIRYKLVLAFSVVLTLAAGVALYGIHAISQAGDLVVRLYDQSFMATSHARAAQAKFNEARAAMDRGLMLREAAPASNIAALEAAVKEVAEELKVVAERMSRSGSADGIKKAEGLAQEWYQSGLRILRPPADGLLALPDRRRSWAKPTPWGRRSIRSSKKQAPTASSFALPPRQASPPLAAISSFPLRSPGSSASCSHSELRIPSRARCRARWRSPKVSPPATSRRRSRRPATTSLAVSSIRSGR
jgi:hypothetical protein